MHKPPPTDIAEFFIAGINYKKTDAFVRGQFAINSDQYEQVMAHAPSLGVREFFVLSTCNRTEIYGFAEDPATLCALLCSQTNGGLALFMESCYIKSGVQAIEHLFVVASGLDSQILGDYEIVGQIKQSVKFSKQRNFIGAYLERMINDVLKSSKNIRTNTVVSGGTVSVSFAAIQYIKLNVPDVPGKSILMIGLGKMGSNICKNITDHLPGVKVMLVNRTAEKAFTLATQLEVQYDCIENIDECISNADIIIVATTANEHVLSPKNFKKLHKQLIIDLSVPCNVAPEVSSIKNKQLIGVDELSKIKDATLLKRAAEIPKVKLIIEQHIHEFLQWHEMRKHVPVLKVVKNKLLALQSDHYFDSNAGLSFTECSKREEDKVQKVINEMAVKMRTQNQAGCHYIEAINDFISPGQ